MSKAKKGKPGTNLFGSIKTTTVVDPQAHPRRLDKQLEQLRLRAGMTRPEILCNDLQSDDCVVGPLFGTAFSCSDQANMWAAELAVNLELLRPGTPLEPGTLPQSASPAVRARIKRLVHRVLGWACPMHKRRGLIWRTDDAVVRGRPKWVKTWTPSLCDSWDLGDQPYQLGGLSLGRLTDISNPTKLQGFWVLWKLLQTVTLEDVLAWDQIDGDSTFQEVLV